MLAIERIKNGATFSTKSGEIFHLVNSKQMADGFDVGGAQYSEIKRIWRAKRISDGRMFHFKPKQKVILLDGVQLW